jgi:hypothetical protein
MVSGQPLGLPRGVREVLERRLDRLSVASRRSLELASLVGASFGFEFLARASGAEPERILALLDEAVRAAARPVARTAKVVPLPACTGAGDAVGGSGSR